MSTRLASALFLLLTLSVSADQGPPAPAPAPAPATAAASFCRACATTTEVSILISDPEFRTTPGVSGFVLRAASERWFESARPSKIQRGSTYVVNSIDGVRQALIDAANRCQRVKFLGIDTHGSPGSVYFGTERIGAMEVVQTFGGMDCVMAPNARIELNGCNAGRGCRGEDLISGIASQLLTKGGSILAPTFYSSTPLPGLIPHFSLNADNQILTVGAAPAFTPVAWDDRPHTPAACSALIAKSRAEVLNTWGQRQHCPASEDRSAMENCKNLAISQLDVAAAGNAPSLLLGQRPQFNATYRNAASVMDSAYRNVDCVNFVAKKLGPCSHPSTVPPELPDPPRPPGAKTAM